MRKTVVFCLLILAFAAGWGQDRKTLPGFWGIPWGTNQLSVAIKIFEKGDYKLVQNTDGFLMFTGIFGNKEALIAVSFYHDKMMDARVLYPLRKDGIYFTYQYAKSQLINKYGPPTYETIVFQPPYSENGGSEDEAILAGKAELLHVWVFGDGNFLQLNIEPEMKYPTIVYVNTELKKLYLKE